ncbi:MBL fold metallo-hydrolase [Kocuria varians]|uniref:Metallo-beta-lactamase type 2 n=1 Tax=Kocuria varians TaxID=1272 RepID=A0A7D7Q464_KOCVA|nr:MBL fold metallo-hydrolase [Kocuria varians]QMS55500.1 Metallo-beta-lactamase type 2 [Kocuria varians]
MARTQELRRSVYVIGTENWRLNSGLVVGTQRALVIDTGAGPRQGREILAAVRDITTLPLTVVNTHAHYDHYMGNAVFARAGATEFWAHKACATAMGVVGEFQRSIVSTQEPEMGEGSGIDTQLVLPTNTLPGNGRRPSLTRIDLGERPVTLFFLGPGHTDNDVCVGVEDVVFCGDLVEEGADPNFEDAYPQRWAESLRALATLKRYTAFVPGHGTPVTANFVAQQADTMELAVRRAQDVLDSGEGPSTAAMYRLPYQAGVARVFLDRLALIESETAGAQPPQPTPEPPPQQYPGTPPAP